MTNWSERIREALAVRAAKLAERAAQTEEDRRKLHVADAKARQVQESVFAACRDIRRILEPFGLTVTSRGHDAALEVFADVSGKDFNCTYPIFIRAEIGQPPRKWTKEEAIGDVMGRIVKDLANP